MSIRAWELMVLGTLAGGALLACKKSKEATAEPVPAVTAAPVPTPAPTPAATPAEPEVDKFAGEYITNWGKAKCTQVKRNVNCLYQGKGGALDCKVVGTSELECDWDERGSTGKAKFKREADGKLVGSWGNGSSATNGGSWTFKPVVP